MVFAIIGYRLINQRGEVGAPLHRNVVDEGEFGHGAQSHALGEFTTQETGSPREPLTRAFMVRREYGEPDLGMFQIGGDVDGSESNSRNSGVFHIAPENIRQFLADLLGDSVVSLIGHIGGEWRTRWDGFRCRATHPTSSKRPSYLDHLVAFELVTFFDVIEVLE